MKKSNIIIVTLCVIFIISLSACGDSSEDTTSINLPSERDEREDITDEPSHSDGSTTSTKNTTNEKVIQNSPNITSETKLTGRKSEFLEKLNNIQIELDSLPEKNDADNGITNAMKNFYGVSYEMYDKALNEIYTILKDQLSPETMSELKTMQINWIKEKEQQAIEEKNKYNGGTFENVAYFISLYESTKERCYQLVNEYMID